MRKIIVAIALALYAQLAMAQNVWVVRPQIVVPVPLPLPVYNYPVIPGMVPYYPGIAYPDYIYRPPMYRQVTIFVPECGCYRNVTVQVN